MSNRQQFDTYAKSRGWSLALTNGFYDDPRAHEAWTVWLASRAACIIDLPQGGYFAGFDNEHMMESRDVREAIDHAGVHWK